MNNELENAEPKTDEELIADTLDSQVEELEKAEAESLANESEKKEAEESTKKINEAMGLAVGSVKMISAMVEKKWSCIKFDDETKVQVSEKAAAVLTKYNCKLPPWLEAYKEELELGVLLGGIVMGCYSTIQKQKKIDSANDEGGDDGNQPQQQAA